MRSEATTLTEVQSPSAPQQKRDFIYWFLVGFCLLVITFLTIREGPVFIPFWSLILGAVFGPKGSFLKIWKLSTGVVAIGAVLATTVGRRLYENRLARTSYQDWITTAVVMAAILLLLGWKDLGTIHKRSRSVAWIFAVLASHGVQAIVSMKQFDDWAEDKTPQEMGFYRESTHPSYESVELRIAVFILLSALAYFYPAVRERFSSPKQ